MKKIIFLILLSFFLCSLPKVEAKGKTAFETLMPLSAKQDFKIKNFSDGTLAFEITFSSATDIDTLGYWISIADYPRIVSYAVVKDTQKVRILWDYTAGNESTYLTYDPSDASDTISTIGTALPYKAGTTVLRAYGTDNIPGANYIRPRCQSITGSEYDDNLWVYLYRGQ